MHSVMCFTYHLITLWPLDRVESQFNGMRVIFQNIGVCHVEIFLSNIIMLFDSKIK